MKNLAGDKNCDSFIVEELMLADIQLVRGETRTSEVPASVTGKLGECTFTRAWYYWCVSGNVPFAVAQELYTNPIGKKDVRVAGHCGCPPPDEWACWFTKDGLIILPLKEKAEMEKHSKYVEGGMESYYFTDEDPSTIGAGYVTSYHIDSQEGLNLFAETMKKHGLV